MADPITNELATVTVAFRSPPRPGKETISDPNGVALVRGVPFRLLRNWFGRLMLAGVVAATFATGARCADQSPSVNAPGMATSRVHHVVISIDTDDEKHMGHAIAYTVNLARNYQTKGERFEIEIVANGSGIKLFRADTSPLQQPLLTLRASLPGITYSVCESSKTIAEQKEGHAIPLIDGARLVPYGIGRLVDLQEAGWVYIHG